MVDSFGVTFAPGRARWDQVGRRLQPPTGGGRRPPDDRGIGRSQGAPEGAAERVGIAAHRARIGLADRAADHINPTGARAAPAVNRGPVDGVTLAPGGKTADRYQNAEKQ